MSASVSNARAGQAGAQEVRRKKRARFFDPPSSEAGRPPARFGVVLSVEVLMAGVLLLGVLMLTASMEAPVRAPARPVLEQYAQGILQAGAEGGQWTGPLAASRNDSAARALLNRLPPGLCAQAELYANNTTATKLAWSYVPSNCSLSGQTPMAQRLGLVVNLSSENLSYYWVRVRTYPKEG